MYGFRFPLLLTSCHMLFSLLALAPFMLRQSLMPLHRETLARQWKGFVAIGLFMALNISLNNSSLVEMTLSLNQVIRASIPVFTCVLAVAIEGKRPSRKEALSLLVLTLGVMIAVWEGTVAGSPRGVALCLAGTVSNALMMTTSGKVLSERVDALRLTFYTAPVSLAALAPAFLASGEASRFANDYAPVHGREACVIALAPSAVSSAGGVLSTAMNATAAVSAAAAGGAMMNPNRLAMGPSDMAIDLLLRPAPDQAKAVAPAMPATAAPATDPKPAAPGMPSTDMSSTGMSMDTMHRAMREERRGELQAPLARVFMTSLRDGTLAARDRTYLAQIVSHQTGLPQAEAEKRVDEVYAEAKAAEQKARDAAERARKLGAIGAFLAAATLAIACAAACIAAAAGGRHRDETTPARMFGGRRFW